MIKGKSSLNFGNEDILSNSADLRAGHKQNSSLQKGRDIAAKFASYLQTESKGPARPVALRPTDKNDTPQGTMNRVDDNASLQEGQKGIAKGVSGHFGGRYAIGMGDSIQRNSARTTHSAETFPVGERMGHITGGTLNNRYSLNKNTMGRALQSSTTPLKTLSSMPEVLKPAQAPTYPTIPGSQGGPAQTPDMGISNTTKLRGAGLTIGKGNSAVLALHTQSHRKHAGLMRFDFNVSSGQETRNLLQAFKKAELTLKNNGVTVAEAPYKSPVVKKMAKRSFAKGAAAFGYTGKYAMGASKSSASQTGMARNVPYGIGGQGSATIKGLGNLCAKFESGDMGISAVGYDRHGGTSYGKFQISSRAGTMKNFIIYLKSNAPDLAERLSKAGPSNTGSRNGRMPREWQAISAEQPERFENLQNNFIEQSHFEPALTALTDIGGVNYEGLSDVVKEVVFSTAVQHGSAGAARIINKAIDRLGSRKLRSALTGGDNVEAEQALIRNIYAIRSRQFGSSSGSVRTAVKSRLRQEMQEALSLLKDSSASNHNTQRMANNSNQGRRFASFT